MREKAWLCTRLAEMKRCGLEAFAIYFHPRTPLHVVSRRGGVGQFWLYTRFLEHDLEQDRSLSWTKMRHTMGPKKVDSRRVQLSPRSTH